MKKTNELAYTITSGIAHRELKGQILFLRPGDRHLFTMNETGRFVWQLLLKRTTVDQAVRAFSRRFSVSQETAGKDVRSFLRQLERRKIIRPVKG